MKTVSLVTSVISALALAIMPAKAQTTYFSAGNGYADGSAAADGGVISSVVVGNDANNITFTINSTEAQASYIFYAIEIQQVLSRTQCHPVCPVSGAQTQPKSKRL